MHTAISIHSLHTEGDRSTHFHIHRSYTFQSTPSTRRETEVIAGKWGNGNISIHSLHTEGDLAKSGTALFQRYFNPLPPHGGRHNNRRGELYVLYFNPLPPHGGRRISQSLSMDTRLFQSTPSTRRETISAYEFSVLPCISIHSLHTEGDITALIVVGVCLNFNPLPPHGGRHHQVRMGHHNNAFQSTPSTRRETLCLVVVGVCYDISIHSLHTEGDC